MENSTVKFTEKECQVFYAFAAQVPGRIGEGGSLTLAEIEKLSGLLGNTLNGVILSLRKKGAIFYKRGVATLTALGAIAVRIVDEDLDEAFSVGRMGIHDGLVINPADGGGYIIGPDLTPDKEEDKEALRAAVGEAFDRAVRERDELKEKYERLLADRDDLLGEVTLLLKQRDEARAVIKDQGDAIVDLRASLKYVEHKLDETLRREEETEKAADRFQEQRDVAQKESFAKGELIGKLETALALETEQRKRYEDLAQDFAVGLDSMSRAFLTTIRTHKRREATLEERISKKDLFIQKAKEAVPGLFDRVRGLSDRQNRTR